MYISCPTTANEEGIFKHIDTACMSFFGLFSKVPGMSGAPPATPDRKDNPAGLEWTKAYVCY